MIGRDHHERVVVRAEFLQPLHELLDQVVHVLELDEVPLAVATLPFVVGPR